MKRAFRLTGALLASAAIAGCASVDIDNTLKDVNTSNAEFTGGQLELRRTQSNRAARSVLVDELLAQPLSQNDAVRLALANSPAMQALIAQGWADMASADQRGRMPNPVFSFERMQVGSELEIGRLLSFGLVDLILLPQRLAIARSEVAQAQVQLSATVVEQVTNVRQAWVRAVAAQQQALYAERVQQSAEASAELARRMLQVGNFNKLQRARQQAFYADATTQLAAARHAALATREQLVRALGLHDEQAGRLALPERLPDLPKDPKEASAVAATASEQRLDVQLARARLDAAGRSQGINLLSTFVDADIGVRRDSLFDNAGGNRGTRRGYELDIRLPLFDWGSAQRGTLDAQSLVAANRYDATVRSATSQLRQDYWAYRSAYDVARHYRDEVVPLRKTMADENLLRYNAMLIGVFELLADAREQAVSVSGAIGALEQFWLADAGLAASVIGTPFTSNPSKS